MQSYGQRLSQGGYLYIVPVIQPNYKCLSQYYFFFFACFVWPSKNQSDWIGHDVKKRPCQLDDWFMNWKVFGNYFDQLIY